MTTILDAEAVAVAWAKAAALNSGRVATRLPEDWEGTNFIRVFIIDAGYAMEDGVVVARLQWDIYAHNESGSKPDTVAASALARAFIDAARSVNGVSVAITGDDAWIYNFVSIRGPQRIDEDETGWARYLVETTMLYRRKDGEG